MLTKHCKTTLRYRFNPIEGQRIPKADEFLPRNGDPQQRNCIDRMFGTYITFSQKVLTPWKKDERTRRTYLSLKGTRRSAAVIDKVIKEFVKLNNVDEYWAHIQMSNDSFEFLYRVKTPEQAQG
ncbi:hypothetical protein [Ferrimonas marina]|uniref:Uncharacterized protein n=1 Tax=Ferrimonas marina TaxID=299255 RepID=A0A1M5TMJ0_9GAMM|nr:hypothetical protein [Ferrimonas marina]SHH51583.1 hypothetical protein SAMN02745129_2193 [Ferrimonas marina]